MEILKYEDLHHGGFAGLEERRFVMDSRIFGRHKNADAVDGIGNFVYLADANFLPKGQTGLHPHREIDVLSLMVSGQILHQGSLENGENIDEGMVQVQRAGGEGFSHNEINPDNIPNNMIQFWVLPEKRGGLAGYKTYKPGLNGRTRIYGGNKEQTVTFPSETLIDIVNLNAGDSFEQAGEVMAYFTKGSGVANQTRITPRTLVRNNDFEFTAEDQTQFILIYS